MHSFGLSALFLFWFTPALLSNQVGCVKGHAPHREDRILVQPKGEISLITLENFHASHQAKAIRTFHNLNRLQVLLVPPGSTADELISKYQQSGLINFAEPDYIVHSSSVVTPNDPKFLDGTSWGLNNTGQNNGTVDADIDAPEAWSLLNTASNVVVAVLDTGVRATHEDLAANMWVNPVDRGHGFNALAPATPPNDDNGHGTLMSGILGALGNNGKGMAGVAWRVQIMACKCLDSLGNGADSDIITCIDYARTNGAKVINASFDTAGYSQAMFNIISATRDAGILFVASAGNNTTNLDISPRYPSSYNLDNIITVAYTTRSNTLGRLSNFGATNVDLAAPGAGLYSTFFTADNAYLGAAALEGTSFAAPYVSGALALMLTRFPNETHQQIIARLLDATDPLPSLAGKCVTGGLLNLYNALNPPILMTLLSAPGAQPFQVRVSGGSKRSYVIEASTDLAAWSPIFTNTTSAAFTFDFTDDSSAIAEHRFYRAVSIR
jgi:subtilisin family serine protease